MNKLPFHRWTFKFHNIEHEQLFEHFADKVRLTIYKLLLLFLGFVGFIFLIQFLVQQESYILYILLSFNEVAMLILYILSEKSVPYLKYLNLIIYVCILGLGCFIVLSGFQINKYLYGYACSCVTLPLIQYSHYRLKVLIIILFPVISLIAFSGYTLYNIPFILLFFMAQAIFAVQLYYNEYFLRLSFSFYQITLRQREILEEYITDPLLAISFDKRTQQFQPEFENQEFRRQFQDLDLNYLKEFLRMITIEPNFVNQSSELIQRRNEKKAQTLEELCYALINSDYQLKHSNCGKTQNSGQPIRNFSIEIKKIFLTQPILLIRVKYEKNSEIQEQNEQKIKYYKNLINIFAIQITEQSEKLQKKYICQTVNQIQPNWFEQSIHLLIVNKIRNFWVLINNGSIKSHQFKVQKILLQQYLSNIESYFDSLGKYYDVSFIMQNFSDNNLYLQNSIEMLTQILINLYEVALKYSQKSSKIILEIQQNDNLNPKFNSSLHQIVDVQKDEKINNKFLVKFNITFFSQQDFELRPQNQASLNPKNLEDFQYSLTEELDIMWPVSCFALSKIGPYNDIETKKSLFISQIESEIYYYQMTFYIYSDCSSQEQSFLNYIMEK